MPFLTLVWIILGMLAAWPSLGAPSRDIFTNESETRQPAEDKEFEIALGLNGCAGSLIAPNVGISAAHCRYNGQLKSGIALRSNKTYDGSIARTVEVGSPQTYDYWIFEITWKGGKTPAGMRVVPFIQTKQDELSIGPNDSSDKIFTLGFPADISHGKLISSWGYGKRFDSRSLMNNISLINGNSGGGIFRSDDEMLVSIVSGGPHAFQQPGWDNNDWDDSSHWNNGPALWKVYAQSAALKSHFPNGKNKHELR